MTEATAFRYKVKRELEEKTYEDLHRDTMAFGRMLEEKGMRGKHIAVIGPTSYGWITSYFGAANSKSVAVPIDVQLPAEAVCELLNRADVEMLVFDEGEERMWKRLPLLPVHPSLVSLFSSGPRHSF